MKTTTALAREAIVRSSYTRAAALQAASYELVDAEGCYSGAYPTSRGWCLTAEAADAVAEGSMAYPPGNSCHWTLQVRR